MCFNGGRNIYGAVLLGELACSNRITRGDGLSLLFICREEMMPSPTLDHRGEFPRKIRRVLDARIHAKSADRREKMHGITSKQHPARAKSLCEQALRLQSKDDVQASSQGSRRPRSAGQAGRLLRHPARGLDRPVC